MRRTDGSRRSRLYALEARRCHRSFQTTEGMERISRRGRFHGIHVQSASSPRWRCEAVMWFVLPLAGRSGGHVESPSAALADLPEKV